MDRKIRGKVMCIDYGDKFIGIAFSDRSRKLAIPSQVYKRSNALEDDIECLCKIIKQNNVRVLVFGLPLLLGGEESEMVKKVRQFASIIKGSLDDVCIEFVDERFSSHLFQVKNAKKSKQTKFRKDAISAAIILQAYLDKSQNI